MASSSLPTEHSSRRSAVARILALLALLSCVGAVYLLVSDARPSDEDEPADKKARSEQVKAQRQQSPETYVVQGGDTLTAIAQATGVSTAKISKLNPDVDTATLNPGQTLKLR